MEEDSSTQPAKTHLEKYHKLSKQFLKYLVVAFIGLVVDFGTLIFLHEQFGLHPVIAAAGGFLAGLTVNFILSIKFVFKNSKLNSRWVEFGLFGVIGLVGLGILSVSMWLMTDVVHINYIVAKVLATGGVYVWNFAARKSMYRD